MDTAQLQEIRSLFPVLNRCVYFNHASNGPLPLTTARVMREYMERWSSDGEVPYEECEAMVAEARAAAAQLLRVEPGEIAFTKNTSAGIIVAIGSIAWQAGDNVILLKDAFPANWYPFQYLLPEVEKRYVTSAELAEGPDCVFRLVDRRTRAVSLEWVHFLTGIRADILAIAEFCRSLSIYFIIDAIQGLGTIDMDFTRVGADFASASTGKWLLGPQGSALLYVNRKTLPRLRPYNLGWLSGHWEEFNDIFRVKELKEDASRFEEGTKNYLGICGVRESLRIILDTGVPAIEARIRSLTDRLRVGLTRLGYRIVTPEEPERSAGIVTCSKPGDDMTATHKRLTAGKMVCSLRANCLRIAPHFYNTEDEVDRFLAALAQ